MLGDAYVLLRRLARQAITRVPLVDHIVGDGLRKLEHLLPLGKILPRDDAPLECRGVRLYHRRQDAGVTTTIRLTGDYEPETREAIERHLGPGSGFVDLGAHIGFFSVLAALRVGSSGRVYAFEPVSDTRALLERNVNANGVSEVVSVEPYAIWDRRGSIAFAIDSDSSVSSKMAAAAAEGTSTTVEIPSISLDEYFDERDWPRVDVIKMDIEGAELAGLRGMRQLLQRNPRAAVIFEYNGSNMRRAEVDPAALFAELRAVGYSHFEALHRDGFAFGSDDIEDKLGVLNALAARSNFNVIATR